MSVDPHHTTSSSELLKGISTRHEFAEALTQLRERAGLTVGQVSDAVNVPARTLGGYFSGRHLPPVSRPGLLADVLRACDVTDEETIGQWRIALGRVRRAPGPRPAGTVAPYRGLGSFQPEDGEWFFGRDELSLSVIARLRMRWATGDGPVVVSGPSGSGKSSLLRAGVIPALRDGRLGPEGSGEWPVLLFTPGQRPLVTVATALAELVGTDPWEIVGDLREWPESAAHHTRLAAGEVGVAGFHVVVDQLEEVFTHAVDGDERRAFLGALDAMARSGAAEADGNGSGSGKPAAAVALGLRADFYHEALREPELLRALQGSQVVVGPMAETELRAAIVEPARKSGIEIEDGLVEAILRDVTPSTLLHEAGTLPLLSHALLSTWERSPAGRMTVAAYTEVGGVDGSVATASDAVIDAMTDAEQDVARQILVKLVRVGDGEPHTRRRLSRDELDSALTPGTTDEQLSQIVDRLAEARLVTLDVDTVEITHEALIAAWPRLRAWLDTDRRALLTAQQLDDAAEQWSREGRDPGMLYSGSRLVAAREWVDGGGKPGSLAVEFLDASARRERRRIRTLKAVVAGLVVLLALALAGGTYAYDQHGESEAARAAAIEERNAAMSRLVATRADGLRETDPALARQLAAVAYRTSPTVEARSSLLSSSAGPAVTRLVADGIVHAIAVNGDGLVAGAGVDGSARMWDISEAGSPTELTDSLPGINGVVTALDLDPDRDLLAAAGSDEAVHLYDAAGAPSPLAKTSESSGALNAVALSRERGLLAAGGAEGSVWLWNVTSPEEPALRARPLTAPSDAVTSVAFSPNGRYLVAGGNDRAVHVWDVANPADPEFMGEVLSGPGTPVLDLAFSPNGDVLAAAGADGEVYMWDVTSFTGPESLDPLTGPESRVNAVTFSPDGRTVAAAGSDGRLWLWERSSGTQIRTLEHPGPVTDAVFDHAGSGVFTSSADGVVRRWQLPDPNTVDGPPRQADTDAVIARVCSTGGDTLTEDEWAEHVPGIPYDPPC